MPTNQYFLLVELTHTQLWLVAVLKFSPIRAQLMGFHVLNKICPWLGYQWPFLFYNFYFSCYRGACLIGLKDRFVVTGGYFESRKLNKRNDKTNSCSKGMTVSNKIDYLYFVGVQSFKFYAELMHMIASCQSGNTAIKAVVWFNPSRAGLLVVAWERGGWISPHLLDHPKTLWKSKKFFCFSESS